MEGIVHLTQHDYLYGQTGSNKFTGNLSNKSTGNLRYVELVETKEAEYFALWCQNAKTPDKIQQVSDAKIRLVNELIKGWRSQRPPCRFLMGQAGKWHDVGDVNAK